jgi:flagellar biogenesis protein FliO
MFLSLAVVIGLMVGVTTFLKRRGLAGFAPTGPRRALPGVEVEVLARKTLGRNASVAVVRAGGKGMVIGVTDHQVTLLSEAELEELELEIEDVQRTGVLSVGTGATTPWKTMLEGLRDRTVRRP